MLIQHQDVVDAFRAWYNEAYDPSDKGKREVRFVPDGVTVKFPDNLGIRVEYPGYSSTTLVTETNRHLTAVGAPLIRESDRVLAILEKYGLPLYPNTTNTTRPMLVQYLKRNGLLASDVFRDGDLKITYGRQSITPRVATVAFKNASIELMSEPEPVLHFKVGLFSHVVPLVKPFAAPPGGVKTMAPVTPKEYRSGSSPLPMPNTFVDASVQPYVEISKAMAAR